MAAYPCLHSGPFRRPWRPPTPATPRRSMATLDHSSTSRPLDSQRGGVGEVSAFQGVVSLAALGAVVTCWLLRWRPPRDAMEAVAMAAMDRTDDPPPGLPTDPLPLPAEGLPCLPEMDARWLTLPGERQTLPLNQPHLLAAVRCAEAAGCPLVHVAVDDAAARRGLFRLKQYGTLLQVESVQPVATPDGADPQPMLAMVTGQRVALRGLVLQTMPFLATAATPVVHRRTLPDEAAVGPFLAFVAAARRLREELGLPLSGDSPTEALTATDGHDPAAVLQQHRAICSLVASAVELTAEERLDLLAYSGEDDPAGLLRAATALAERECGRLRALKAIG
eukprot:EG_transcript_16284